MSMLNALTPATWSVSRRFRGETIERWLLPTAGAVPRMGAVRSGRRLALALGLLGGVLTAIAGCYRDPLEGDGEYSDDFETEEDGPGGDWGGKGDLRPWTKPSSPLPDGEDTGGGGDGVEKDADDTGTGGTWETEGTVDDGGGDGTAGTEGTTGDRGMTSSETAEPSWAATDDATEETEWTDETSSTSGGDVCDGVPYGGFSCQSGRCRCVGADDDLEVRCCCERACSDPGMSRCEEQGCSEWLP